MNNNYDDERANRQFSILCYVAIIAFGIGAFFGLITYCFITEYLS